MEIFSAIAVGLVTGAVLWKPFFEDWEGFKECVEYWLTPDILSALRGNFHEDWWAEMKLGVWVLLSAFTGFSFFKFIH